MGKSLWTSLVSYGGKENLKQDLTGSSKVVNVRNIRQTEVVFEFMNFPIVICRYGLVDVVDDSLNVGGAVLGHILPNRFVVPPKVTVEGVRSPHT